jgi:hypothetical protein
LKYIIKDNGQIITVNGRKFYYPPNEKWIKDRYLELWTTEKLRRLGIYKYSEQEFDFEYFKIMDMTITYDDVTMTAHRAYTLEPRQDPTYWRNRKRKQYKREGIQFYANAIKIEPILEFTGDTADLITYKQAVRDAFTVAKQELNAILNDGTLDDFQKYEALNAHQMAWPDPPLSEEDLADYGL